MPRCPNCNYTFVLFEHRRKYECPRCSRLYLQQEIEVKEFIEYNKRQRQEEKEKIEQELKQNKEQKPKLSKEEKLARSRETQRKFREENREPYNQMKRECWARCRERLLVKRRENYNKNKSANVKIITTDGLTPYPNVVKSVYGYYNLKKGLITHKVVTASKGEGFNIWIERLHNTIRQRTQNFRGFHGSVESAYALMKGLEIYYNFIRKHEALKNKTPSELATNLKFKSPNRWLELIEIANSKD